MEKNGTVIHEAVPYPVTMEIIFLCFLCALWVLILISSRKRKRILILSANPITTPRLLLDKEVREIKEGLRRSKYCKRFKIYSECAVRLKDLRRALLDYKPHIVHFAGHGSKKGILVQDDLGDAVPISSSALSELFKLCSKHVECIILNACYAASQVSAISKHINYVIGMRKKIEDKDAIEFSVGFYDALGAGKSVEEAFKFGCSAIPSNYSALPILKKKNGREKQGSETEILEAGRKRKKLTVILKISISFIFLITISTFIYKGFIGPSNNKFPEINMIHIPKGNFLRGTSASEIEALVNDHPDWRPEWFTDESPQRQITIDLFYISKFEITNKQYGKFLKDNPAYEKPAYWDAAGFNDPDQPVVGVSWNDAVAFCNWLSEKKGENYRLPTEAEWEKAARGTDARIYPWGNTEPDIRMVNFSQPYVSGKPMPIGYYAGGMNPLYGTMEMAGNVAEWCCDWYDENYYRNFVDNHNPDGPLSGQRKVVRGGSWMDNAFLLRCTARSSYPPHTQREFIGFRVVLIPGN
ncbi:MAG: SUMF1/EgtB/PvdO family nonheme iron enzyme [Candidatus Aminicenantes bacterium]|nr:SUMF1/EgtB/PvdO family nonheme iron enzyme [Candidatus Aminicenantes bacterium]NIM80714.1 SUMF1/EgtB/PvdO family nonheme iron enzyme [Candidatus Aminicenantes bacterium]NIN20089.1 SUMF1/EgtB/PvdO family nonheme iron enzyme [Candidatus Aminicenantes bacterium]NIN43876.1 SUMF1/EgtB/PvdO family nonheme iron enzyme [Candidatus Aminicenantes bacterium]NIN86685.1 SUMF1/EgtB/PvdO family nonheme iron enzyme [Candidatus Aminicenantes bacterium]